MKDAFESFSSKHFCQVSDDDFCLPQPEEQRSYRGTIALKVSKRKPKPTQKILDMEAELLTKARQERMEEVRRKIELNFFLNKSSRNF